MLKPARILSVVAACVAVVAALVLIFDSSNFQTCVYEEEQTNSAPQPGKSVPGPSAVIAYGACFGKWANDNNGAITALSTALLVIVTAGLAWIARQQYTTSRAQLRAYVFVQSAKFAQHPKQPGTWYIHVELNNYGETPARRVVTKVQKEIGPEKSEDLIIAFNDKSVTYPSATIAPKHFQTVRIHCPELDKMGWNAAGTAKLKAYVWGRLDYVDAFRQRRWLTFQMVCHFGQIVDFAFCKNGNYDDGI